MTFRAFPAHLEVFCLLLYFSIEKRFNAQKRSNREGAWGGGPGPFLEFKKGVFKKTPTICLQNTT